MPGKKFVQAFFILGGIFLFSKSTLLAQVSYNTTFLSNRSGPLEDCWGYEAGGKEYALICRTSAPGVVNGIALIIVDVTDPTNPITIDSIPRVGGSSDIKDVEVYQNYAYAVCQSGPVHIIDLSFLPDSAHLAATFSSGTVPGAHTIHISGNYAYLSLNGVGPRDVRILDLSTPTAPVEVGHYTHPQAGTIFADGHDSYVFADTLLFVANLSGGISIVNVVDKTNPVLVKLLQYPGNFTHNVWTSGDGKYLYSTDEVVDGHVRIWDIQDTSNITQIGEIISNPNRIVHNVYIRGNFAYMSYYTDGLQIADISNPASPVIVAYYDSYPGTGAVFNGAWSVYPFTSSNNVYISDFSTGLWVVSFDTTLKAGYVNGTVTDAGTSAPLEGVEILSKKSGKMVLTTGDGSYLLGLGAGTDTLIYSRFGYDTASSVVAVVGTDTVTHNQALNPVSNAGDLAGRIKDKRTGLGINQVLVELDGVALPPENTNSNGEYSFSNLPAMKYKVKIARFGYIPFTDSVQVVAASTESLNVDLKPGFKDDFEFEQGWLVGDVTDDATTGILERANPEATFSGLTMVQPEDDNTPADGINCYVTGAAALGSQGGNDVDGGKTSLFTPEFDLSSYLDPKLVYYRWYTNNTGASPDADTFTIQISNDNGVSWVNLENTTVTQRAWTKKEFIIKNFVALSSNMKIRFIARDTGGGSIVEAAVDDFEIFENYVAGDLTGEGNVSPSDLVFLINYLFRHGAAPVPLARGDVNQDCKVSIGDLVYLINFLFKSGPAPLLGCA